MLRQILDTIRKYNMLEAGDEVIAALSGGADSVCLLLALIELRETLDIKVSAIHVNHCLRGEESMRDEDFCRDLCKKHDIPFIFGRFDVKNEAIRRKQSVEQAARNIRYEFFAQHSDGRKLATAHNANDNTETIIFNLARGTGIKGIAGIPPVRDNIIRPLLEITRQQIEKYLSEQGQSFVTDSTNLTDDYTRNRIRHNVIPALQQINPSLFKTISSDSNNFRIDNSYMEEQAETEYRKRLADHSSLTELASLHTALRRRCISMLLSENNIEINSKRISDIDSICMTGGKINICKNTYIISENGILSVKKIINRPKKTEDQCLILKEGSNILGSKEVTVSIKNAGGKIKGISIDADKLKGTVILRHRLPGDRIKLHKNNFTSSVKKLFNSRLRPEERDSICFIADDDGPVFIENIGFAERVNISESTKKIMEIRIHCV